MHAIVKEKQDNVGYEFPFEGEKHLATAVILPYREDTWREKAKPALDEYFEVVKAISQYEKVLLIADPAIDYHILTRFQLKNVTFFRHKTDDSWARDTLPVFLRNKDGYLLGVDYGFNSWGGDYNGLYFPYDNDNNLGKELLLDLSISRFADKDFILEGGSIHTDGEGTLLTTECCLLSKGRNPKLNRKQIEEHLKKTLNQDKVIFLPFGIYEDETSGHIDNICCFLEPGAVLLAYCDDQEDPQYLMSRKDYEVLSQETDSKGRKLKIIKMPLPKPLYLTEEESQGIVEDKNAIERKAGRRLAASYVNCYIGETYVLLPQFGVEEDKIAFDILAEFYRGKKTIIPIRSREILLGGGNIHCITKQIPFSDLYEIESTEDSECKK